MSVIPYDPLLTVSTACSIDFVKLHGRMQSAELAEKFPVCYGI